MTILLIDTSKPIAWVGLSSDGRVIAEKEWTSDKTLGAKLLEAIAELVPTSVDRIAINQGSGLFMAARTGAVTAQLLAQAWGVELVSVEGRDWRGI